MPRNGLLGAITEEEHIQLVLDTKLVYQEMKYNVFHIPTHIKSIGFLKKILF